MSDHSLMIELGRYQNIPRSLRICKTCNELDNEIHFFLLCKQNKNLRSNLYLIFDNQQSNFEELDNDTKINTILNPSTPAQIKAVSSFIEQSLELRKEDHNQS